MQGQQPPSKPNPPLGSIDFELTDFDEARRALDELPAGVEAVQNLMTGDWEHKRRKPLPSDRALTGVALDWVVAMPPNLRPYATCEQFPRVVNAIAESWSDTRFSVQVLDHMINDYRGGRRGFPPAVRHELDVLHAYRKAQLGG